MLSGRFIDRVWIFFFYRSLRSICNMVFRNSCRRTSLNIWSIVATCKCARVCIPAPRVSGELNQHPETRDTMIRWQVLYVSSILRRTQAQWAVGRTIIGFYRTSLFLSLLNIRRNIASLVSAAKTVHCTKTFKVVFVIASFFNNNFHGFFF